MPGEVVGTAFVRIKALTSGLAKDIKSQVEKGAKDAGLDKIGKDAGKELGENLGESSMDSAKKTIKKESKGIFQDVADEAKLTSKKISEHLNAGTLRPDLFDDRSTFDKFINNLKIKLNSADLKFREFTDNIKARFHAAGVSVQTFVRRTSAGFRSMAKIDKDSGFDDALIRMGKRLKDFGEGGFTDALSKIPLKITALAGAVVGALPYIQDIGAAILAYATGLVAQVGFLVTAVGGLGVAAAGALGSSLLVALPIVLAFQAGGEKVVQFKDAIAAAGEEIDLIGIATQQTLLPALEEALFILLDLVQPLSEFGLLVGRAVGDFALFFANVLTGEEALGRFQDILQSSMRIFDMLVPIIINVGNILSGIWVAAIPASERLVGSIGELTSRWAEMVSEGLKTGTLVETFDLWYDRAQTLGSALGNLTGALFDILQVGANSSDDVFKRFDDWAERFREFTESEAGKNRLAIIFDNALEVMREVNGVVADLFDGIFGRLDEIGGVDSLVDALQRFRDVLPGIQESWAEMYGQIKEVVEFIIDNFKGKVAQAIEELAEPLGRLAFQILDLLKAMEESGAFEVFLELLKIMTDVLSTLLAIPGFGTFIGYMLAFGGAIKIAKIALGPFVGIFGSFIVQMGQLVAVAKGRALTDSATALTRFVAGFRSVAAVAPGAAAAVGAAASTVAVGAGGVATSTGIATTSLGLLGAALPILGGALVIGGIAFFNHQQKVQAWRQEIRQAEDALGTLNGGLFIAAEGIQKYIEETSRFAQRGQLDEIALLGFSPETLATRVAEGTLSLQEFAQAALDAGDVTLLGTPNRGSGSAVFVEREITSLEGLQEAYDLTNEEFNNLLSGHDVFADRIHLIIEGNTELLGSFSELRTILGEGVKNNIDDFISNQTNIDLLGPQILTDLRRAIEAATPEEAVDLMGDAFSSLRIQAEFASAAMVGVSEETRRQIEEQVSSIGDLGERALAERELLLNEQARVFTQIQNDFELFNSNTVVEEFGAARQAVFDFSDTINSIGDNIEPFDFVVGLGIDTLLAVYPQVADATLNLFDQLSTLPEDEFNAFATTLGANAEDLRLAMEGARQAIADLQDQAIESLPTIGSLLQDATEVQEDGSQFFDPNAFLRSAEERIEQTDQFSRNIAEIARDGGQELARLATQQGPEAAASIVELLGQSGPQLNEVIARMEESEAALAAQIRSSLGPAIALEYATAAKLVGSEATIGLSAGLNDPVAVAALLDASEGLAEMIASQLEFTVLPTADGIRFVNKPRNTDINQNIFSEGGYVDDKATFGSGPFGSDTVNAWLTPGEFVLRRAVAQAIPSNVLTALNAGDTRMIGLLNGLEKSRPAGVDAVIANVTATVPGRTPAGGFVIEHMSIEAPTPLESARQVADRLRIMQSQLSSR